MSVVERYPAAGPGVKRKPCAFCRASASPCTLAERCVCACHVIVGRREWLDAGEVQPCR